MDGRDGIGQVVTDRACRDAVRHARQFGIAVIAVRNSNHFGTAAYWTRRMADQGASESSPPTAARRWHRGVEG